MATHPPADRADSFNDLHRALARNIGEVIQGKPEAIDLILLGLIAEGHLLVEDVPGVGKTTLAKALARSIDGQYGRIQFTPGPAPVRRRRRQRVEPRRPASSTSGPGPIFANVVLADEINRASPKTQSALLEAMAERQVTIDGTTRHLPPPFLVIATQNPIENEGTYPLPESQLDRFLLKVSMGYPDRDAELADPRRPRRRRPAGRARSGGDRRPGERPGRRRPHRPHGPGPPGLPGRPGRRPPADHPHVAVGMSPRATLALQRVARARAATRNRTYVTPDDIKALAVPVLAHRLLLSPAARVAQATAESVVADVLGTGPAARGPARAERWLTGAHPLGLARPPSAPWRLRSVDGRSAPSSSTSSRPSPRRCWSWPWCGSASRHRRSRSTAAINPPIGAPSASWAASS